MIGKRALLAALVGILAMPVLIYLRHYPWRLAAPVAIALGIFAYLVVGTVLRLREETRRRRR